MNRQVDKNQKLSQESACINQKNNVYLSVEKNMKMKKSYWK